MLGHLPPAFLELPAILQPTAAVVCPCTASSQWTVSWSDLDCLTQIGQGGFGTVHRAVWRSRGLLVGTVLQLREAHRGGWLPPQCLHVDSPAVQLLDTSPAPYHPPTCHVHSPPRTMRGFPSISHPTFIERGLDPVFAGQVAVKEAKRTLEFGAVPLRAPAQALGASPGISNRADSSTSTGPVSTPQTLSNQDLQPLLPLRTGGSTTEPMDEYSLMASEDLDGHEGNHTVCPAACHALSGARPPLSWQCVHGFHSTSSPACPLQSLFSVKCIACDRFAAWLLVLRLLGWGTCPCVK
jgi:hypothetical protein